MLVLTREKNQKIIIDERIVIEVVDFGRGRVKIGVTAPKETNIRRDELPPLEKGEHRD